MTTVRAVLLRCDHCGEIFDHGNRSVREAVTEAELEGWRRIPEWRGKLSHVWRDLCSRCITKGARDG